MLEWEEIKQNHAGTLFRVKVVGGWLVKEVQDCSTLLFDGRLEQGLQWTSSITFVPDPLNIWKIYP